MCVVNREEKNNLLVGAIVTLVLIGGVFAIFLAKDNSEVSARYVLISSIPTDKVLRVGDLVFMNGKKIGVVQSVSEGTPRGYLAVRMKVSGEAFDSIGEDSVAWVSASGSPEEAMVVIEQGVIAKSTRFVKIKPVRGVLPPKKSQ